MPLSFPGSTLPNPSELQFKDGKRQVAEYLSVLMANVDTPRYTYQEAIDLVNRGMVRRSTDAGFDKLVSEHFSEKPS